jgi:hypothetical protein
VKHFEKKNYRCSLGHLSKAFLIANEYRQTKIVVVCGDIFQNTPVVAKVLRCIDHETADMMNATLNRPNDSGVDFCC